MTLDVSRAMRPLTQLSSFITKQLNAIDKAVMGKMGKAPAAPERGAISGIKSQVSAYLKEIERVQSALDRIQKQRLTPVRTTAAAQHRQAVEQRVFSRFQGRKFGASTFVATEESAAVSKTFKRLMEIVVNGTKSIQVLSESIRKGLIQELGAASKSIIGNAVRLKRIPQSTANTFNRLWVLQKQFGDKSIVTAKTYFARGVLIGQRGMERFWNSIKKAIAFLPSKAMGLFGKLGQTGVGKTVAGVAGKAFGGLSSILGGVGKIGNIAGMLGKVSKALGPIGAIISGIVKGIKLTKKVMLDIPLDVVKKAASFALLPLRILNKIHSVLQSISFTIYILWSILSRTLREPLQVMKEVEVAMSIAEDNLLGVGEAMNKVTTYAEQYAIPITEIAHGFYEVVRSGFNATEAVQILDAAMQYAVTTGGELNRAIDQIIGVLRAFEMDVSEASNIVEVLHKAVGSSRAALADLQTALGYAGPAAVAAGLSFKEAVAILTMFRNANLRASRAGMTFRAGLDAIQRAVATATGGTMTMEKAVKHLGLAWEAMVTEEGDVNIRAVFDEFSKLEKKGLSVMDKLALRTLFQGRHWANWYKLLKMGRAEFEKRMAALEREIDLTEKANELNERLWAIGTRLGNVWTVFKMGVIKEAMPSLEGLNDFFKDFVEFMHRSASTIGKIIKSTISKPAMDFIQKNIFPLFSGTELTSQMEKLGEQVRPVIEGMWEDLNSFLQPFIEDISAGEWSGPIVGALQIIRALLRGSYTIVAEFYRFIKDKWAILVEDILIVLKIITGIFEFLLPKAEALLTFALDAIIGMAQAIGDLAGLSSDKIQEIQDNIRKLKEEAISGVKDINAEIAKTGKTANETTRKVFGGRHWENWSKVFSQAKKDIGEIEGRQAGTLMTYMPSSVITFGAWLSKNTGYVREQKEVWRDALREVHESFNAIINESETKISSSMLREAQELSYDIMTLLMNIDRMSALVIRSRARDLEISMGAVINQIKNEVENTEAKIKAEKKVAVEITPSKEFDEFMIKASLLADTKKLRRELEDYSESVARQVVNNETGAYG